MVAQGNRMSKLRASFHAVLSLTCLGTGLLVAFPAGAPAPPREPEAPPATATALASAPSPALDAIATASLNPNKPRPLPDTGPVLAYAREAAPVVNDGNPALSAPPPILVDVTGLREAIAAYRAGDLKSGDAAAQTTTNPNARTAADWAALRLMPRETGLERIMAFLKAQPDWPTAGALRRRAEEAIFYDKRPPAEVIAWFTTRRAETALGKWALARALQASGAAPRATTLVREIWREADLAPALEAALRKDFPDALTRADHKARSDRLFYKENDSASQRAAALAGPDVLALAKARETISDKTLAALTPELRKDPSLQFAQIQKLRRDNKIADAAKAMLEAPRDPALLVSPDDWWTERRTLARKLLDIGDARTAWRIAAEHSAQAKDQRIDAEFHAGWIALRYLSDAALAAPAFERAASLAESPISIARAAYWQGRAAEALGKQAEAQRFFEKAATQPIAYYGQLALTRLGRGKLAMRQPARIARGDDRIMAIRVVELLGALDQKDLATPLATESARTLEDEAQLAALGAVAARARDARTTLMVGKLGGQRGFLLDETAFPIFGIPAYEPLTRSATPALVYAIARQESSFEAKAQSGAGAKGLMQMLPSTARRTAQRAGVPFDERRLLTDASFNAQLGAAHLGELMAEHPGSLMLTFAAYNAGGRRVKEWIAAYGDPRDPAVDPIDWVERIPFTETRNYVQRVTENLEVYRLRFGESVTLDIERTLRSAER